MADKTPWIRTSEQMPEPETWVLGYSDDGESCRVVQYYTIRPKKIKIVYWVFRSESLGDWTTDVYQPDFWMPIPPVPSVPETKDG